MNIYLNIFLLLLSFCYLIVEIVFNINFVNIISQDNLFYYPSIGDFGRHVASIGASLLLIRLFFNKVQKVTKTLFIVFSLSISLFYFLFFIGQEKIVDYISNQIPSYLKKEIATSYFYQKSFINSGNHFGILGVASDSMSDVESVVFKSSLGFLAFSNNGYMNIDEKTSQERFKTILINDLHYKPKYYKNIYDDGVYNAFEFYKKYDSFQGSAKAQAELAADNAWSTVEKYIEFSNKYNSAKRSLDKDIDTKTNSYFSNLKDYFFMLSKCDTQECFNAFDNKIRAMSSSPEYDFPYVISVQNNCNIVNGSKSHVVYVQNNGRESSNPASDMHKYLKGHKSLSCNIDLRGWENTIKKKVVDSYVKRTGVTEWHHKDQKSFLNSGALNRMIIKKSKESGIILPSNWTINDKKTFYSAVNKNAVHVAQLQFNEMMELEFGFSLPLNLPRERFFNNPNFENYFKDKMGLMYVNYNVDAALNTEHFVRYFSKHFEKKAGSYLFDKLNHDTDFIDDVFKANLVPLISISLSLTFGFVNFLVIVFNLLKLCLPSHKVVTTILFSALIVFWVLAPLTLLTYYQDSEFVHLLSERLNQEKHLLGYYYKWLLNLEVFVYNLFNETVNSLDFVTYFLKK